MGRTQNAKRNIIFGFVNQCVCLILPFVTRTVIIKTLGADYLGLSSLFTSILQVLNLTELGFSSAVVFCMYKPLAENDTEIICALMNYIRRIYKVIGVIFLIVGFAISPFLPCLIKGSWPSDINIFLLFYIYLANTAISYLLFAYKSALLVASQRNDIDLNITTWTAFVQYIIQIVILISTHNFYYYALIFLAFTIVGNLQRYYITNKKFPQYKPRGKLSKKQIKFINQRVAGAFVQKICATTRNSLDSIFLSVFLGLTTITIYSNYYLILSSVHGVLYVIITAITAGVGDSIASESVQKNYHDLRKFTFMYAWISGACTVCLVCLYQPFMQLWVGTSLMFPFQTVVILCFYFYSLTMGDIKSAYTTGAGLWWEGRYRSIAETICNLILNWVLGYFFGVDGIIFATIISIILINFIWGSQINFEYYFKEMSIKSFYLDHLFYIVTSFISCVICFAICNVISSKVGTNLIQTLFVRFFISIIVGNIIFFVFYKKSKFFNEAKGFVKTALTGRRLSSH